MMINNYPTQLITSSKRKWDMRGLMINPLEVLIKVTVISELNKL